MDTASFNPCSLDDLREGVRQESGRPDFESLFLFGAFSRSSRASDFKKKKKKGWGRGGEGGGGGDSSGYLARKLAF